MSFLHPVTPEVLAALPPDKRRELAVYSKNHAGIFDLWLHTLKTCPLLSYTPTYARLHKHVYAWAEWLHGFFRAKHLGKRWFFKCPCESELQKENP